MEAIDWAATGGTGPGQRFAAATNIRTSIPNEYAKAASEGQTLGDEVSDEYWWKTSLSHMARSATNARTRSTHEWISSHVRAERRYKPPAGKGVRRKQLECTRKALVGHFYQLLSGRAATRSYLHDGTCGVDADECWWCGSGERQPRHRLSTSFRAWAP